MVWWNNDLESRETELLTLKSVLAVVMSTVSSGLTAQRSLYFFLTAAQTCCCSAQKIFTRRKSSAALQKFLFVLRIIRVFTMKVEEMPPFDLFIN